VLDPQPDRGRPSPDPEGLPDKEPHRRSDEEPDVRFTYANERTFLAWNRTSLALIATGVAATQLLPKLDLAWGRRLLGLPLIVLGAVLAVASFLNWRANERAMRRGEPLPRSVMPVVLCVGITVVGVLAVVVTAMGKT
jgi:inner membrane protein YidH